MVNIAVKSAFTGVLIAGMDIAMDVCDYAINIHYTEIEKCFNCGRRFGTAASCESEFGGVFLVRGSK